MASEEGKEVEIDMTANGSLDWVLHEIAKNLDDISFQLMVANRLKAEEISRKGESTSCTSTERDRLLWEHSESFSGKR